MPKGKIIKIGVWEGKDFIGVVLFAYGASPQLHKMFNISRLQICELVRVALRGHMSPVSKIIRIAIALLKKQSPGLRMIVSFADPNEGHIGVIYQAGNWIYLGRSTPGVYFIDTMTGKISHNRKYNGPPGFSPVKNKKSLQGKYTERKKAMLEAGFIEKITTAPKHKYVYPLDPEMRNEVKPLARPYPKRAPVEGSSVQEEKGSSNLTRTLQ